MSKHTPKNILPKEQREDSILEHGLDLMKFARTKTKVEIFRRQILDPIPPQFDRAASKMGEEQRRLMCGCTNIGGPHIFSNRNRYLIFRKNQERHSLFKPLKSKEMAKVRNETPMD